MTEADDDDLSIDNGWDATREGEVQLLTGFLLTLLFRHARVSPAAAAAACRAPS